MENSIFSDMKFFESAKNKNLKIYKPYKQVGFFEDKILNKNIGFLKNNLEKKDSFLQTYNSPKGKRILSNPNILNYNKNKNIEQIQKIKDETNTKQNEISRDSSINMDELSNERAKSKQNLNMANSKEKKIMKLTKKNSRTHSKKYNPTITNNSNFSKLSITAKNNQHDIENNITNSPNIIKNKIISGHINKELQNDIKKSEISSNRNTLYSNFNVFLQQQNKIDYQEKSPLSSKKFGNKKFWMKNVSVNCGLDSFKNSNKFQRIKFTDNGNLESKIDFVYKKIFDKKSRHLFETSITDKEIEKMVKLKKKEVRPEENIYDFDMEDVKKKKYIDDKIQDIKRKIFFIKGVYDFSYPKIIVKNVSTAQEFYKKNHVQEKLQLRQSLNATATKMIENKEKNEINHTENFKKSFYVQNYSTNGFVNLKNKPMDNFNVEKINPDILLRSHTNFNSLKNCKLTLTSKYNNPNDIEQYKVINPIAIQSFYS